MPRLTSSVALCQRCFRFYLYNSTIYLAKYLGGHSSWFVNYPKGREEIGRRCAWRVGRCCSRFRSTTPLKCFAGVAAAAAVAAWVRRHNRYMLAEVQGSASATHDHVSWPLRWAYHTKYLSNTLFVVVFMHCGTGATACCVPPSCVPVPDGVIVR